MEIVYFKHNLDIELFRTLNKDRSVSYHFRPNGVGKCVKIFDDYYQSSKMLSMKGWHKYYFDNNPVEPLIKASKFIMEKYDISERDAKDYVYYRVVGQTWNGMMAEYNVINILKVHYPQFIYKKAPYEIDEYYFTDWEIYYNDKLIFGIQIKPISYYNMSSPHQARAKQDHNDQRDMYRIEFNVPHFMVYYEKKIIVNLEKLKYKIDTHIINRNIL